MKRIVVGTDLTPRSKGAVTYAAELAEKVGAPLHLVAATPMSVVGTVSEPALVSYDHEAIDACRAELDAMAGELRRRGLEVECHAAAGGAADVICQVAETVDADLIVVGNKRMQGKGRVLGSVPNRVAHHATCSVLIVRTG